MTTPYTPLPGYDIVDSAPPALATAPQQPRYEIVDSAPPVLGDPGDPALAPPPAPAPRTLDDRLNSFASSATAGLSPYLSAAMGKVMGDATPYWQQVAEDKARIAASNAKPGGLPEKIAGFAASMAPMGAVARGAGALADAVPAVEDFVNGLRALPKVGGVAVPALAGAGYGAVAGAASGPTLPDATLAHRVLSSLPGAAAGAAGGAVTAGTMEAALPYLAGAGQGMTSRLADAARSGTHLTVAQTMDTAPTRLLQSILGLVPTGRMATLPYAAAQADELGTRAASLAQQMTGGTPAMSVEDAGTLGKARALQILQEHQQQIQELGDQAYITAREQSPRVPLTPELQAQLNTPTIRGALQRALRQAQPAVDAGRAPLESPYVSNASLLAHGDPAALADLRQQVYAANPALQPRTLSTGQLSVPEPTTEALLQTPAGQAWNRQMQMRPDLDPGTLDALVTHLGELSGKASTLGNRTLASGYGDLKQQMLGQLETHAPLFAQARAALAQSHADFRSIPVPGGPGFWDRVANGTPQQAYQLLTNHPNNAAAVQAIRTQMGPVYDQLAARHFLDLGTAVPSAQGAVPDAFSPAKFLTQWNRQSPATQQALYQGINADDRGAFARTIAGIKENPLPNPSGTAGAILGGGTLNKILGEVPGMLVQADVGTHLTRANPLNLAGELLGPIALAKANQSPTIARGIAGLARGVGHGASSVSDLLDQLFPRIEGSGPPAPPGGLLGPAGEWVDPRGPDPFPPHWSNTTPIPRVDPNLATPFYGYDRRVKPR